MKITPKNWDTFQHYKDRSPAWIKLHRGLLDDFSFSRLPVASRALAPLLWLLASEYERGEITASTEELAFRLRMSENELRTALTPLIDSGFFNASEPLAGCKQEASLEKRDIENIDKRKRREETREVALLVDGDFDEFWERWPNKVGKPTALKAYRLAAQRVPLGVILIGVENYIRDKPPDRQWLNPATFLNQNRWEDQPANVAPLVRANTVYQQRQVEGREILNEIDQSISRRGGEKGSLALRHDPGNGRSAVRSGTGATLVIVPSIADRSSG